MYKKNYKKTTYKKKVVTERPLSKDAKYLIIVESPSKCQKIEGFLGSQYHCIASKGHIRTIAGLTSIDCKNNFDTEFTIIEDKKSHIESMQKTISQFPKENIILAMDDDREGEGIAWHICQVFELDINTTKRILFREITKTALEFAVSNPGNLNMTLVHAQQTRQILDMIVGYKISPILWKYLYSNKDNSLSAGRCQTPALRLVYDMEMEESMKDLKLVYKTTGTFFSNNILFELSREFENEKDIIEFLEDSKDFEYNLSISEKKSKEKSPPKPFNTSNLLQTASNILSMSPKETTSLCQQLYQDGHITYIRTDSMQYSATFITEAKNFINEKYRLEYFGNILPKDEVNPHEAIRVTHIDIGNIQSENKRMQSLYKLIWKNTVESCMSSYTYTSQKSVIGAPMKLEYSTEIEIPIFLGWKKVSEKENETETKEQNKGASLLFYLETLKKSKKPFSYNKISASVSVRGAEKHYTEASLIKRLEDLGIGRPSTFASIIDTILERGYVKKTDIEGKKRSINEYSLEGREIQLQKTEKIFGQSKNKLVIQSVGILTIEFLIKYFSRLFSYEYTKDLEVELDEIATAKKSVWYETCRKCKDEIETLVKSMNVEKPEYKIDENHVLVYEKYGPVIKKRNGEKEKEGKGVKPEYLSINPNIDIDLEKLKRGEYKLEDILKPENKSLGKYENEDMYLKNGKYGYYVQWGENTKSIRNIETSIEDIELKDIIEFLNKNTEIQSTTIIREISKNLSIRKGKIGAYIFYKRPDMKKPEFFNLKKFKGSFTFCEKNTFIKWMNETYKINESIDE